MRGKVAQSYTSPAQGRITPACAGKSKNTFIGQSPAEDHPRMCGEKALVAHDYTSTSGSPPHVRGKDVHNLGYEHQYRITPACAGKSTSNLKRRRMGWDHPRMCGEKVFLSVPATSVLGSPPHVRGKGLFVRARNVRLGITPACAGKRLRPVKTCIRTWDHPRMCGEKFYVDEVLPGDTGSPPHVRGKVISLSSGLYIRRITPACAGKSDSCRPVLPLSEDHPRMCGEK